MLALNPRLDGFKFKFPKEFLDDELKAKYGLILAKQNSFFTDPIEFLNETIKSVSILGFNNATVIQGLTFRGLKSKQDNFMHTSSEVSYRSGENPINLFDKTLVITFRHTIGYLNYFMIFENFFYQYAREYDAKDLAQEFYIYLYNNHNQIYSRIVLFHPLIDGIENLNFDYTNPVDAPSQFVVNFKYSNIDFQFLNIDDDNSINF